MWIWYRCQSRIENYYHHDGEQLGFYKKAHTKTQSKKKDVLVTFFILLVNQKKNEKRKLYLRERQMPYSAWRKLTLMNRNWTGKLQITEAATGSLL